MTSAIVTKARRPTDPRRHPSPEHLRLLRDAGVSVWEQIGEVEAAKNAVADGSR